MRARLRSVAVLALGPALAAACSSASRRVTPAAAAITAAPPPAHTAPAPDAPDDGSDAPDAPDDGAAALARAFLERMTVWTRADGARVLSARCRAGPVDCEARLTALAREIAAAARRHGLDPFLLGALAWRESGLDPAVLGRNREAGIVQLHPRGAGRGVRYVEDARFRAACQREVDACQGPVLDRGAETLAREIARCGSLRAALGAFASGRCTGGAAQAQRVLEEERALRALTALAHE